MPAEGRSPTRQQRLHRRGGGRRRACATSIVVFAGLPLSYEQEANDRDDARPPRRPGRPDRPAWPTSANARAPRSPWSCRTARPSRWIPGTTVSTRIVEAWLSGQGAGAAVARRALRAGEPVRQDRGDLPAGRRGHARLPELDGRTGHGALRRGRLHRLPLVRRAAAGGALSVRAWTLVHVVRVPRTLRST